MMRTRMTRRHALTTLAAGSAALAAPALAQAPTAIKVGFAISKTGPNAGGANVTTLPNYQLWARDVNEAGGIAQQGGRKLPVELVEYDDRSNSEEAVRAIERLISQDRVDFILPPWGTALNLAIGPALNRAGYPHLAVTAVTDRAPELARRWPNSFWLLGTSTEGGTAIAELLARLATEGRINRTLAMVSVADQFGIELAAAARPAFQRAGFTLAYDRSYPVGTQDLQPVIAEAMRAAPDAFVAFSYPPDTLALTEQARIAGFNPKVFYTAVGTAFPLFKQRFAANAEGVMGIGGWNADSPPLQDYLRRHAAAIGREPDRWASPVTYMSLQMLQQAIERVGRADRAAVIADLQGGTFQTILGAVKLEGNIRRENWWVGQWQNGEFYGIAPASMPGARQPTMPKPAWRPVQ